MNPGEGAPSEHGTFFASPGRATPAEVSEQAGLCLDDPMVHAVLEAVDSYAVILNAQRQILAANPVLLEALSDQVLSGCRGLRLGEALACAHATEGPSGCGTSRACRLCGALLSMLATIDTGECSTGECLLTLKRHGRWEAREYTARSFPLIVAGERLTLLTLQDISAKKRRESLERIFLHDLMNSLQGLRGWTELLQAAGSDPATLAERILGMAGHLTAEVESQRRILQAESGELQAEIRVLAPVHILDDLEASLEASVAARLVRLPLPVDTPVLRTDPAIVCRILNNMVINAVEALPQGGQVQLWYEHHPDRSVFTVQNPGCIPPDVADRIFQRSFSTKALQGRGLGTYSMKLLGETVLGGRVGFTTSWDEGTRFYLELPVDA